MKHENEKKNSLCMTYLFTRRGSTAHAIALDRSIALELGQELSLGRRAGLAVVVIVVRHGGDDGYESKVRCQM